MEVCPVCKKPAAADPALSTAIDGATYYFRCPHCKERFDADPGRFLEADGRAIVNFSPEPPRRRES